MAISNQKVLLRFHAGLTITINDIDDDAYADSVEHGSHGPHGMGVIMTIMINMMMLLMMIECPFRKLDCDLKVVR